MADAQEHWKRVERYDDGNKYEVSDRGNVREWTGRIRVSPTPGRIYKPVPVTGGMVKLSGKTDVTETVSVEQLVRDAFPQEAAGKESGDE